MALRVCQICAVDFTLKHFLLPLIDGMAERGWQVTSVCSDGPHISGLRQQNYSIKTIYIQRSFNIIQHVRSLWELYRYFKKERFDIVHVHSPIAAMVGRIAARLAKIPVVVYTAHGFYFHDEMLPLRYFVHLKLEQAMGRLTDILFTQSHEDAVCARMERILPSEHIYTVGNGVNPAKFDPAVISGNENLRISLGIPEEGFVIGIIARLVEEKGVLEFLEAAMKLAKERDNVYFLLIGNRLMSDHAKSVAEQIETASRSLPEQIILTGERSDIPQLISIMDVFCLPSWREGMPRSIIEAMMMGKPVIATDIRGSREEVVDGETGFLVPVRDADALAERFVYCVSNRQEVSRMGLAGRRRALELFDERKIVELQLKLIECYIKDNVKS